VISLFVGFRLEPLYALIEALAINVDVVAIYSPGITLLRQDIWLRRGRLLSSEYLPPATADRSSSQMVEFGRGG